jgi:hypothetical protein
MCNLSWKTDWRGYHGRDHMVDGFLRLPPTNKTDHHDITEILLKVALNTINQTRHLTIVIFIFKAH